MILHIIYLLIFTIIKVVNNCKEGKGYGSLGFPTKETDYEVRPNLFIGKDNLIGKINKLPTHNKKEYTYGSGPMGPSHWPKLYPKCAGKHQSPINIEVSDLKTAHLGKLKWNENYGKIPQRISVTNTGHAIQLTMSFDKDESAQLEGGPLDKPYNLQEIHFHWASTDHKGSEHTICKKSFPLEMHALHYRSDLNSSTAGSVDKGLCVLAYIFEVFTFDPFASLPLVDLIGDNCNEVLTSMFDVSEMLKQDRNVPIDLSNMFRVDALLEKFEKEYVTYHGSLTAPPCYESVIWILSPYTMTLSKKQMEKFRAISASRQGFSDNFRPTQPINGRIINFVN